MAQTRHRSRLRRGHRVKHQPFRQRQRVVWPAQAACANEPRQTPALVESGAGKSSVNRCRCHHRGGRPRPWRVLRSGRRRVGDHPLPHVRLAARLVRAHVVVRGEPAAAGDQCYDCGLYEATAIWDVRSAVDGGREVRPAEQHIHSLLESLPFMAVSALFCLHWDEVAWWRCHLVGHLAP